MTAEDGVLEARLRLVPHPGQLICLVVVTATLFGQSARGSLPWQVPVVVLVLLGWSAAVQAVPLHQQNRVGCAVRLDGAGVRVGSAPLVPWSDLDHVRVTRLRLGPRFLGGDMGDVVALVPRSGVDLPPAPGGLDYTSPSASRTRCERYGSSLAIELKPLNVSTKQLLTAVEQWGGLPVLLAPDVSDPRRRPRP